MLYSACLNTDGGRMTVSITEGSMKHEWKKQYRKQYKQGDDQVQGEGDKYRGDN